jgi:DnaJ-class molecular chaperone
MRRRFVYVLLGLSDDATYADFRAAARRFRLFAHPDRHAGPGHASAELYSRGLGHIENLLDDEAKWDLYREFGDDSLDDTFDQDAARSAARLVECGIPELVRRVVLSAREARAGARRQLEVYRRRSCTLCRTRGTIDLGRKTYECPRCEGAGHVIKPVGYTVKIPPGTAHGTYLRMPGIVERPGEPANDLLVEVWVRAG